MRRSWLVVLVAVAAAVGAVLLRPVAAEWRAGEPAAPTDGPSTVLRLPAKSPSTSPAVLRERAVGVLHAWDRRRAEAYAGGDVTALRRLYVPGSTAGRADVRLLKGYRARGYVVTGMRMQLLAVTVLEADPDRLRLRVTDRLRDAVAVAGTERVSLPRDEASARVLVLRRDADRWQVAAVRDAGDPVVPVSSGRR